MHGANARVNQRPVINVGQVPITFPSVLININNLMANKTGSRFLSYLNVSTRRCRCRCRRRCPRRCPCRCRRRCRCRRCRCRRRCRRQLASARSVRAPSPRSLHPQPISYSFSWFCFMFQFIFMTALAGEHDRDQQFGIWKLMEF